MALGKNLIKNKLIPEEGVSKKTTKKVEKKTLISDKPKKKPATPKKSPVKKKKPVPAVVETPEKEIQIQVIEHIHKEEPKQDPLANYIAQKALKRKKELRTKYKNEIDALSQKQVQFVVFTIGKESYAIDISKVREIIPSSHLSEVPNSSDHIKGIASIRGKAFLAIDLAVKFGKQLDEHSKYFLAVDHPNYAVAFILEKLPETLKLSGKHISSDISLLDNTSRDTSYLKGFIQLEGRLIFYLDSDELIASDEAIIVPDNLLDA